MTPYLCFLASWVALTGSPVMAQVLVAGWDFQTTTTGGTAVASSPNTPKIYSANFGSGSLYLDGSNGSSDWVVSSSGTELSGATGSTGNRTAPGGINFANSTTSPAALHLANTTANKKSAVFVFSMEGKSQLTISLSTIRTNTGFDTQTWDYSANGGASWNNIGSVIPTTSYQTFSVAVASALDGIVDARVRVIFDGATGTTGNNRWDNIQFVAIPEPSSSVLMMLGGAGLLGIRAMRRKNSLFEFKLK